MKSLKGDEKNTTPEEGKGDVREAEAEGKNEGEESGFTGSRVSVAMPCLRRNSRWKGTYFS